jgi:hypothetical protein
MLVEREQAVPEARRADGVVLLPADRLVHGFAHELHDSRRIVLAGVLALSGLSLLSVGVEDLRPDRGRPDVECQHARHEPYPYSPWPS